MLADDDVVEWTRRDGGASSYTDERMRGDMNLQRSFARRLLRCGVAGITNNSKERVTPFFVHKKNGKQRLVLDCRRVSDKFRDPPSPDLGTGECFSRLNTAERSGAQLPPSTGAPDEGPPATGAQTVFDAESDIKNCFCQCAMPCS